MQYFGSANIIMRIQIRKKIYLDPDQNTAQRQTGEKEIKKLIHINPFQVHWMLLDQWISYVVPDPHDGRLTGSAFRRQNTTENASKSAENSKKNILNTLYINFRSIIIESKRIEHVLFLYSISRKFGVEAYLSLYYNRITIFSFRSWFNVAFS